MICGTPGFSRSLLLASTAILTAVALGCGSSRHLQSVTLTAASADAQNFPKGQVPFTATGTFSAPPSPVQLTSMDVTWCSGSDDGTCVGNAIPAATVDQSGLAQCRAGFTGTATILAGKPSPFMGNPDSGAQLTVFGVAHLTCP
jgi:hypothetical protein